MSVGMSNGKRIWDTFTIDAEADPLRNPDVQLVNGASSGGAVSAWADGLGFIWGEMDEELDNAGKDRNDVSVIWWMIANNVSHNSQEDYSSILEADARTALDLFAAEFPNLKVVWVQSMIYAGYSTTSGNYEPFAYETGLVADRLVADQSWPFYVGHGPYMWADGLVPRGDGLIWLCEDFADDGNHPERGAKDKMSEHMLQFFQEDSVASIGYLDVEVELTAVPDVVGLAQAAAESSVVSSDLVVGTVSTANDDTVAVGNVISQNPAGGASVAVGSAVNLVVSLGPAQIVSVPDVVGLAQAAAESAIEADSLVVGNVSSTNSDTVALGSVISQSPASGTSVNTGTSVGLVVSLGPVQLTTVPDVVSLDQATAESSIASSGLIVGNVSSANSDTVAVGNVISQDPAGGTSVNTGTTVDLVVSLGTAAGAPMIISPVDGSTLTASSETFTWSAEGADVTNWRLDIGTTAGGKDLYTARLGSSVTSQLVTDLPTDGSLIYVALKWKAGGPVEDASYVYTATGGGPPPDPMPEITSPTPGSTLSLGDVSFSWTSNGAVADDWQLLVGTSVGSNSFYDSGVLGSGTTSAVVSGLPEDGSTIHVTLRSTDGGNASEENYTYTAATAGGGGGVPMMLSPADGSTLAGSSETFTWSDEGVSVDKWRLEVGTTVNGRDLFVQNIGSTTTSMLVSGLPTDGSIVYVNLKWRVSGVTSTASYIYTASTGGQ
jgi:beta-lactam-binding protein with PASTA domain